MQTILEGTTSQGEDQQSILQALQRQAEKDPDFYGSSGSETPLSKPAAGGAVKDILFLDLESCYWQFHRFSRPQTSSAPSKIIQSLGLLPPSLFWWLSFCDPSHDSRGRAGVVDHCFGDVNHCFGKVNNLALLQAGTVIWVSLELACGVGIGKTENDG